MIDKLTKQQIEELLKDNGATLAATMAWILMFIHLIICTMANILPANHNKVLKMQAMEQNNRFALVRNKLSTKVFCIYQWQSRCDKNYVEMSTTLHLKTLKKDIQNGFIIFRELNNWIFQPLFWTKKIYLTVTSIFWNINISGTYIFNKI